MPADCPNLRKLLGNRFRVRYEESYYADRGNKARAEDPWTMIVPCWFGHLYPHGKNRLAASVKTSRSMVNKPLRALSTARLEQDGSDGANISFELSDLEAVIAIMRPKLKRPKRVLSEEQRAVHTARLAPYRFAPGHNTIQTVSTGDSPP